MKIETVLVVAAHPDDEVLGCGATIAKHCARGDNVHILILAEGERSRGGDNINNRLERLKRSAIEANKKLGTEQIYFHNFPDNKMDTVSRLDVIQCIETYKQKIQPDVVYTHFENDLNIDHQIIFESVVTAFRPLPGTKPVRILSFEVLSNSEWSASYIFRPNWYVDVTKNIAQKIDALKSYETEMRPWPHPRSYKTVEILSQYRGSTVGLVHAEAFILQRLVEPD